MKILNRVTVSVIAASGLLSATSFAQIRPNPSDLTTQCGEYDVKYIGPDEAESSGVIHQLKVIEASEIPVNGMGHYVVTYTLDAQSGDIPRQNKKEKLLKKLKIDKLYCVYGKVVGTTIYFESIKAWNPSKR